ncbi:MAG: TonB-dependent receptor [Sphingobacteriales bacterium]|nr:MAG: TonB-dependent receptor [Sphingobacteriales bacterium]TAF82827.1 MAG: TonB-dependent receptor [Sphingobacteriales bacterium]
MSKLKPFLLFTLFLMAIAPFANAQKISGNITDAVTGKPIENASIEAKESKISTITDSLGNFTVKAKANEKLVISITGYTTKEVLATTAFIKVKMLSQINNLDQVVFIGSRRGSRVKTDSPVPIDVITMGNALQTTARPDLTSMLNYAAPSFNFNKQSGSDGADQIDLATLRGLGPDQTLVLVNGKRRHQTAFVAVFGTRGRGNSGTDLNAIPEAAIDRVEILRDGASAQYGSDAIAGVINIILKKNTDSWQVNTGLSGYYDKKFNPAFSNDLKNQYEHGNKIDGQAYSFGINKGFTLGKRGYINLSGNFFTQGKTFRQVLDTNLLNKDALPINPGRRANGDASVISGGGMFNMELPFGQSKTSFYAFGGYNHKASDAFAYSRSFYGYNPLSSARPARFPTDAAGNLIFNPSIMKSIPTPGGEADTVFSPHIQTKISDLSFAAGLKGNLGNDWEWDASNTLGRNDFHYFGDKTFNTSLGKAGINKNFFDNGGFNFLQNTTNIDFSKKIASVAQGLNLSLGTEYRYEQYNIYAGEEASYFNYDPLKIKASGAQGFPGFQPVDEVKAKRNSQAVYIQTDVDVTKQWLASAAVRVENYSDFGFLSTYKLATRYKVTPFLNLRGSVSTGFRAPSLQQINFSNTFTNVQGGKSFDVKIAPNFSEITRAAGIPALKQEKSVNASVGFTAKASNNFTVTVDAYMVKIKDRVVLSGQFDDSNEALKPILNQLNVAQAQFFANAVNTTNIGVDIVLNYNKRWDKQSLNLLLASNFQRMTIDKINIPAALNNSFSEQQAFFSQREEKFIKASAPPAKIGFTADYGLNKTVKVGTHLTYFGKIILLGYGYNTTYPPTVTLDNDADQVRPEQFNYNGKMVTDVYSSIKVSKVATVFVGVDNLFNIHPNLGYVQGAKKSAYNGEAGGPWDAVQMGTNGMRPFLKAQFNF